VNKSYVVGALSGFIGGIIGAYALGHLGSVLPQAAATAQDVVSASRIRLLDASGRARAELAMSPDGAPGLFFYDTHGRNRLVLGIYSPS
jgi:hypothetical protein